MKRLLIVMFAMLSMAFTTPYSTSFDDIDIAYIVQYSLKLKLNVPRIYNNTQSLGFRKYQTQLIQGTMQLCYDDRCKLVDVRFKNLVNKTHKMSNGVNVSYDAFLTDVVFPKFNCIGSNKTEKFNIASVCFSIAAEPSYNIGEMNEDNGLYIVLAGKGKIKKSQLRSLSGKIAGTIGCGCKAYGHKSPTRQLGFNGALDVVDDIAAVHGIWSAKLMK